ncbi:MAG TPA: VCBS repeat-containing protein [Myxococcaceae bacterium]|jgi:hypothetical protein
MKTQTIWNLRLLDMKWARAAWVHALQLTVWNVLSGCHAPSNTEAPSLAPLPEDARAPEAAPAPPELPEAQTPPPSPEEEEEVLEVPRRPLAPRRFYAGVAPEALALGDFNGDGKTDVAVANLGRGFTSDYVRAPGSVVVVLNDGAGGLTAPTFMYPLIGSDRLAVADMDGDGRQDLLVGARDGVVLLPGRGNGTFATEQAQTVAYGHAVSLETGSFLGDSRPDFWAAAGLEFRGHFASFVLVENTDAGLQRGEVFLEDGTPLVRVLETDVLTASADFDEDGRRDFAMVRDEGLTVFLRTGARKVRPSSTVENWGRALAAGDFDRDGHADVLLLSASGLMLFRGDGQGHLQPAWRTALDSAGSSLLAQDLDGDGWLDAAVTHRGEGAVSVHFGQPEGFFRKPARLAVGRAPSAVAAADLDGDGVAELLVAESDANALFVRQLPRQPVDEPVVVFPCFLRRPHPVPCDSWQAVATLRAGLPSELDPSTAQFVTADLNGDGRRDFAFPLKDKGVRMLLNLGQGTFQAQDTALDAKVSQLAAGDFNGDGRVDLAAAHRWFAGPNGSQPEGAAIYWNTGAGQFSHGGQMLAISYYGLYMALAAADFNADGGMDLAIVTQGPMVPLASLFTSQGAGTFQREPLPDRCLEPDDSQAGIRRPVVADFDGDGRLDFGHMTLGFNLNFVQASGKVNSGQGFALRAGLLSAADVDGDGSPDLVSSSWDGSVSMLRGDLGGTLQHPEQCALSTTRASFEALDLNADGRTDFLGLGYPEPVVVAIFGVGSGEFDSHELRYTFQSRPLWAQPVNLLGDARPELAVLLQDGSIVILEGGCH